MVETRMCIVKLVLSTDIFFSHSMHSNFRQRYPIIVIRQTSQCNFNYVDMVCYGQLLFFGCCFCLFVFCLFFCLFVVFCCFLFVFCFVLFFVVFFFVCFFCFVVLFFFWGGGVSLKLSAKVCLSFIDCSLSLNL